MNTRKLSVHEYFNINCRRRKIIRIKYGTVQYQKMKNVILNMKSIVYIIKMQYDF